MDKKKLGQLIIILFESKMKNYKTFTVDTWVDLLSQLPYDKTVEAIHQAVYDEDDFISIGKIYNYVFPPRNFDEIANEQFALIKQASAGKQIGVGVDLREDALEIFVAIMPIAEYGYMTDDFRKDQIRRDFMKTYKAKLKEQEKKKPLNIKLLEDNNG